MHTKTLKTGIRVQRYFIYLAYDGTNYHGWQIQPNGISVQECLMKALSTFLRCEIEVVGAGRTDAPTTSISQRRKVDNAFTRHSCTLIPFG